MSDKEEYEYPELGKVWKNEKKQFWFKSKKEPQKLLDFWQWAYSDLTNNISRGVLAEYIVGSALGCFDKDSWRDAWAEFDLDYGGIAIEVKCASPYQRWAHDKLSWIDFDISPKNHSGHSKKNCEPPSKCKGRARWSDVYVFCLFAFKDGKNKMTPDDKRKMNPLNLNQWKFYVVATNELNELDKCHARGEQPNVKLSDLRGKSKLPELNPIECKFDEIEGAVKKLIEDGEISK